MKLEPEDFTIYLCLIALSGLVGWVASHATGLSLVATLPASAAVIVTSGHFAVRKYIDLTVASALARTKPIGTSDLPGIGMLLEFPDYWELQLHDEYLAQGVDATMHLEKCGAVPHPSQLKLATSFWGLYVERRDYLMGVLSNYLDQSGSAATLENYEPDCTIVDVCCPDTDHQLELTFSLRGSWDGFTTISLHDWVAVGVESGD